MYRNMITRGDEANKETKKKLYVPRNADVINCGTWRKNERHLIIFAYLLNEVVIGSYLNIYKYHQAKISLRNVFRM